MFNPQMMQNFNKMKEDLKTVQDQVYQSIFYGQSGGSVVKVSIKGNKQVLSVDIDKNKVDVEDFDLIGDMVVAAMNDAIKKADAELQSAIESVTQGMSIPGLF
ncbi:YbaB/EbfC family nucleoid-associated protein [Mycoplasmatota bacterium]|nr:YbaB/EbfC family nucleoid-associated protein [Mycoplasmatota bacterium]